MSFEVTIGSWAIPTLVMILLWIWACWPREVYQGGFFGIDCDAIFRVVVAIVGNLLAWLIYFAGRFIFG